MALDRTQSTAVANAVVDMCEEAGYTIEEAIPGLMVAVVAMCHGNDEYLDEAANILADGVEDEEGEETQ